MPLTLTFMGLGGFQLQLVPETPDELRQVFLPTSSHFHDTVIVTPTRLLDDVGKVVSKTSYNNALLSQSRFTGRIDFVRRAGPNEALQISGPSLLAWLGDQNQKGAPAFTGPVGSPGSVAGRIGTMMTGSPGATNGITASSIASGPGTITDDIDTATSIRDNLERLRLLSTSPTEYVVHPNGLLETFDQVDTHLHVAGDSKFLVGPNLQREEQHGLNLTILPADLTVDEDWSDLCTDIAAIDQFGNQSDVVDSARALKSLDGSAQARIAVKFSDDGTTDPTGADIPQKGTALLADTYCTKYRYTIALDAMDSSTWLQGVEPGANIYVYDPLRDQTDSANPVLANGHEIGAALVQVTAQTLPIVPGMGVYAIRTSDASYKVADLSTFVDYRREPQRCTLEMGTRARTLTGVVSPT
jgi:hypothetical protein